MKHRIVVYEHDDLRNKICAIKLLFPNLSKSGWYLDRAFEPRHGEARHPMLTRRFAEQVARAMAYISLSTKQRRKRLNQPSDMWQHRSMTETFTGTSAQAGAVICALMILGEAPEEAMNEHLLPVVPDIDMIEQERVTVALRPSLNRCRAPAHDAIAKFLDHVH